MRFRQESEHRVGIKYSGVYVSGSIVVLLRALFVYTRKFTAIAINRF